MKLFSDIDRDAQHLKTEPGSYEWWYFDGISEDGEYQLVIIYFDGCPFSTRYIRNMEKVPVNKAAGKQVSTDSQKSTGDAAGEAVSDATGGTTTDATGDADGGTADKTSGDAEPEVPDNALPSAHPAISISVYHRGQPIFYSLSQYPVDACSFDRERPAATIGANSFRFEERENHGSREYAAYDLRINEKLPSGDELKGIITFAGLYPNRRLFIDANSGNANSGSDTRNDGHFWNLALPRAKMQCRMNLLHKGLLKKDLKFNGTGYHDHNTGHQPMRDGFRDWYWGRVHFPQATLVYYVMHKSSGRDCHAWLVSPDNRRLLHQLELTGLRRRRPNGFLLNPARRLTFSDDELSVSVRYRKVVDSGPFYCRYLSMVKVEHPGLGVLEGEGISEYIKPRRIHRRLFWPLVHMRLRYVEENPHWVQNSSRLHRRTW